MPVVVLVDTNVWISAFINPHGFPAKVKDAWLAGEFDVVVSMPLLEELVDVLHRPRIKDKYGFTDDETEEYLRLIAEQAISVKASGDFKVCRDPDDDLILETALVGKANYAVSRDDDIKADEDLIAHMKARGVKVLTVSQFLRKLKVGEL